MAEQHGHHHSHGGRRRHKTDESHRGNRRSGISVGKQSHEESQRHATETSSPHRHGGKRTEAHGGSRKGKAASAVCVGAAFAGLGVELITELVSHTRNEVANPGLNGLGGVLVGIALGAGLFALAIQMHQWSRRVRKRLLIGNTVAGLSLVLVVSNVLEHYRSLEVQPGAAAPATKPGSAQDTDTSLFKPGWYGELQEEGVVLVVTSFAENARESRQFNLRLSKPVSYATFTLINLNSPGPVVLPSLQVSLVLDSGESVDSLEVRPLLFQRASQNEDLLNRLAEPMTVALGGVAADIPICQAAGFKWERVRSVRVTVNARAHVVTGRVMTAEEKRAMLEKPAARAASAQTNRNDHEWYRGL